MSNSKILYILFLNKNVEKCTLDSQNFIKINFHENSMRCNLIKDDKILL